MTGFNEPDAALVLNKTSSSRQWTMYVTPKNKYFETWDGVRTGLEQAVSHFGMDDAKRIESLPGYMQSLGSSVPVFTDLSLSTSENEPTSMLESTGINFTAAHAAEQSNSRINLPKILRPYHASSILSTPKNLKSIGPIVNRLRLFKSEDEIKVMRKSGQISGRAFAKAMSLTKPGMSEHHLQAILNYELMIRGSSHFAYVPVIAGGRNSLTLHYIRNDQILKDNDLVLVDCGGVSIFFLWLGIWILCKRYY